MDIIAGDREACNRHGRKPHQGAAALPCQQPEPKPPARDCAPSFNMRTPDHQPLTTDKHSRWRAESWRQGRRPGLVPSFGLTLKICRPGSEPSDFSGMAGTSQRPFSLYIARIDSPFSYSCGSVCLARARHACGSFLTAWRYVRPSLSTPEGGLPGLLTCRYASSWLAVPDIPNCSTAELLFVIYFPLPKMRHTLFLARP